MRLRTYTLVLLAIALVSAEMISFSTVGSESGDGQSDRDGDGPIEVENPEQRDGICFHCDRDDDGLIEVEYLEQLDAIRFDLDGDGEADRESDAAAYRAAFPTGASEAVCDNNCSGYELARSLDFNDADSYASGVVREEWTTGEGWLPIQSGEPWIIAEYPFAATFDGNGHTISNLYINRPADDLEDFVPVGLFGSTHPYSVIRRVGLIDVRVAGLIVVGGLVGGNLGEIRDSHVTGSVSGAAYVGGLVGFTGYSSYISGSHFSGAVTGRDDGGAIGGLVGHQDGLVSASYAAGSVSGDEYVGGLAGENYSHIIASYSSADVTGNAGVGGLVGVNRLFISGCYATGGVTGGRAVGGLAGYNGGVGRIVAGYASGRVTGKEGVGGLVGGNNNADITAGYATGQVSGNENVGGLVGRNTDRANITASYATGQVSGGDNLGGVVGLNDANVAGAVWDTETSGIANGVGRGDAAGVTGQTSAELQAASGYTGVYRDWEIYLEEEADRGYVETAGPHDFWDFGTSAQYPALRAYLGFGSLTDWWDPGGQPRDARPPAPVPDSAVSPAPARYDSDGDRLIEVEFLEQLDAIRYDLDGDGKADDDSGVDAYAAAFPTGPAEAVCDDCKGYELVRPLDFASHGSYASGEIRKEWTEGEGWRPIGGTDEYGGRFNTHFDGNGHAIANLHIDRTTRVKEPPAVGLFGYAGYSTVILNTGIDNASVAGLENVGGMVGLNMGEIRDSYATGSVSVQYHYAGAGGLVGNNEGAVSGSHTDVSMSCDERGGTIGGLVGRNKGTISDSHAIGSVLCLDSDRLGGLTGSNWGTINNSYATGDIVGDRSVGGLIGSQGYDSIIIASYATGDVTGDYDVGGLAGGSAGVIRGSYATGRVTGRGEVGGLAGGNGGEIIASYAAGEVTGRREVGGLVGSNSYGTIIASYATGAVTGDNDVGGLAGESHSSTVIASYAVGAVSGGDDTGGLIGTRSQTIRESVSFWDIQTTGQETSAAGSGKTTAELQSPTAYTGIFEGWNADLDNADGDTDPVTGADDFWDFGTSGEYPALKFDFDGNGTATWREFGNQERAAPSASPTYLNQNLPPGHSQFTIDAKYSGSRGQQT